MKLGSPPTSWRGCGGTAGWTGLARGEEDGRTVPPSPLFLGRLQGAIASLPLWLGGPASPSSPPRTLLWAKARRTRQWGPGQADPRALSAHPLLSAQQLAQASHLCLLIDAGRSPSPPPLSPLLSLLPSPARSAPALSALPVPLLCLVSPSGLEPVCK